MQCTCTADDWISSALHHSTRSGPPSEMSDQIRITAHLMENIQRNRAQLVSKMQKVVATMCDEGLNLPLFLHLLWGDPSCWQDGALMAARTAFIHYTHLESLIDQWYEAEPAKMVIQHFSIKTTKWVLTREQLSLMKVFTLSKKEFNEEVLLSINIKHIIDDVKRSAPILWQFLHGLTCMKRQEKKSNKNPDQVSEI